MRGIRDDRSRPLSGRPVPLASVPDHPLERREGGRRHRISDARAALEGLCVTYWTPVYAFIRQSGRPADDAQDLTQAFFARVMDW